MRSEGPATAHRPPDPRKHRPDGLCSTVPGLNSTAIESIRSEGPNDGRGWWWCLFAPWLCENSAAQRSMPSQFIQGRTRSGVCPICSASRRFPLASPCRLAQVVPMPFGSFPAFVAQHRDSAAQSVEREFVRSACFIAPVWRPLRFVHSAPSATVRPHPDPTH